MTDTVGVGGGSSVWSPAVIARPGLSLSSALAIGFAGYALAALVAAVVWVAVGHALGIRASPAELALLSGMWFLFVPAALFLLLMLRAEQPTGAGQGSAVSFQHRHELPPGVVTHTIGPCDLSWHGERPAIVLACGVGTRSGCGRCRRSSRSARTTFHSRRTAAMPGSRS